MRFPPFSALVVCGLIVLACPATAWAQMEGEQDHRFQNILRDVTGPAPSEASPDGGVDGPSAPDGSAPSPEAAPSWEGGDAPLPQAPAPAGSAQTAPSPAIQPLPSGAREQSSVLHIPTPAPSSPDASGVWSPETGAPIAGIIPLPEPPPAFLDRSSVKLQTLDKATARTMTFDARVGSTVQFGPLFIKVRACRSPPPEDRKEAAAFLQIWENTPKSADPTWIFSGWMFASSPALSSMDHPIYDVWVISCIEEAGESPTPPVPPED